MFSYLLYYIYCIYCIISSRVIFFRFLLFPCHCIYRTRNQCRNDFSIVAPLSIRILSAHVVLTGALTNRDYSPVSIANSRKRRRYQTWFARMLGYHGYKSSFCHGRMIVWILKPMLDAQELATWNFRSRFLVNLPWGRSRDKS